MLYLASCSAFQNQMSNISGWLPEALAGSFPMVLRLSAMVCREILKSSRALGKMVEARREEKMGEIEGC